MCAIEVVHVQANLNRFTGIALFVLGQENKYK